MVAFSIATLNVDGIRDDGKRAQIFEYLRSLKYDFYLLQKTHVSRYRGVVRRVGVPASGILVAIVQRCRDSLQCFS